MNTNPDILKGPSPKHRVIMRLLYTGMNNTDIGRAIGMSPTWVAVISKSQLFLEQYAEFEKEMDAGLIDLRSRFEELAPDAVEKLAKLMNESQSEPLQRLCAMDILRCAGHGNINKVEVSNKTSLNISAEQANIMITAFKESRGETASEGPGSQPDLATSN